MGYFSELAIEDHWEEREPSYPSRRETLQYFLEDLEAKLEELDEERPHDPMDPYYDRYFYSDYIVASCHSKITISVFCIRQLDAPFLSHTMLYSRLNDDNIKAR